MSAIANRYAKALADVVGPQNEATAAKEALGAFNRLLAGNHELQSVFFNPTIPLDQKRAVLKALLDRLQPSRMIHNFLMMLLENHRMPQLGQIVAAFDREIDRRLGVVSAKITTATPITDQERQRLIEKLNQLTGQQVRLQFQTDPEIIGGVVTQIGSVIYDGSIKNQLQTIRTRLKQA